MEKKKKYWDTYCGLTDRAAAGGMVHLCSVFNTYESPSFALVKPDQYDSVFSWVYWGRMDFNERAGEFNGLRQNLVLLMCAMNEEL